MNSIYEFKDIILDLKSYELYKHSDSSHTLSLAKQEAELLIYFINQYNQGFAPITHICYAFDTTDKCIHTLISKLRRKLSTLNSVVNIEVKPKIGYRLRWCD